MGACYKEEGGGKRGNAPWHILENPSCHGKSSARGQHTMTPMTVGGHQELVSLGPSQLPGLGKLLLSLLHPTLQQTHWHLEKMLFVESAHPGRIPSQALPLLGSLGGVWRAQPHTRSTAMRILCLWCQGCQPGSTASLQAECSCCPCCPH